MSETAKWSFAIDRGGTFTDVIGVDPEGRVHTLKLLSQSSHYADASLEGIRRLLALTKDSSIHTERVREIRMGTTVATNALLERKGELTALFITEGFEDLLEIGYQNRPELFALAVKKPSQLYSRVFEVEERLDANGNVLKKLNWEKTMRDLKSARDAGITSVAVVLAHSWVNPAFEQEIGELAREAGFRQVSLSSEVMRRIKMVGRGQTTMVDAYLSPILKKYVDSVRFSTGGIPLSFMRSSGGLARAEGFTGKDAILSGPAGGVIGTAGLARRLNIGQVIGFDMGGTSTDVCRYGGEYEKVYEVETAGIRFQADMLQVETVASGGGSILGFDGQRMTVGPESAGADPGPACYGKGGPLTITDANLFLGRIVQDEFTSQFGLDEDEPLDVEAARRGFRRMTGRINEALGLSMTPEDVALGYIRIANEIMAKPVKALSISRGFDVRDHALLAFGGAGGLHACSMAKALGIKRIIVHPLAGLFSADGIALAEHIINDERTALVPFTKEGYDSLPPVFLDMEAGLKEKLKAQGAYSAEAVVTRSLDLRPKGSEGYLTVPDTGFEDTRRAFLTAYEGRFGFSPDEDRLEIVNLRVEMRIPSKRLSGKLAGYGGGGEPLYRTSIHLGDGPADAPVYRRKSLRPGDIIPAPALVMDDTHTVLLENGFAARVDEEFNLIMEAENMKRTVPENHAGGGKADPILLEVFNHTFMSVAEIMGETLVKTAHSVNMKERLDFSCAVFDSKGGLVANAPHIPVHLGAMGESVKALIKEKGGSMRPGHVYVSNHPGKGGSHLPDVTVMSPVFLSGGAAPDFFVATRGHHADIGGAAPGSMSPFSKTLSEEGVVIDNFLLVGAGRLREKEARELLSSGPYPARDVDERMSDLAAQIAANHKGETELARLAREYGVDTIKAYMGHIQENAAHSLRLALGRFLEGEGRFESSFTDYMDDGAEIRVRITIDRGDDPPHTHRAEIDFTGSSPQLESSLNAPRAVVRSAVLYVFRTLIERDIPLNDGCMIPLTLKIPEGSMLNPSPDAAVVGGNVETSQRVVDALYGALGIAAASQGTMNNVTMGWSGGRYYETIAGGAGAVEGHDGASAVQVHMTNTRITDLEVLERRYPGVRIRRFSLRKDSGGAGRWKGGDGVVREYEILAPCDVTILSERRTRPPYGMAGGQAGAAGVNLLLRDGGTEALPGKVNTRLAPGDVLRIETPGGGGYGAAG